MAAILRLLSGVAVNAGLDAAGVNPFGFCAILIGVPVAVAVAVAGIRRLIGWNAAPSPADAAGGRKPTP